MDDYIALAIPASQEQLDHIVNAIMGSIHAMFPEDAVDDNEPILHKKPKKLKAMWATWKDILEFTFAGIKKTLWLEDTNRDTIVATLKSWLHSLNRANMGVPFKEFQSVISKTRHTFAVMPVGRDLLPP